MATSDHVLSIGEFARRSWLSPKALRLYERLDVLRPAEVDRGNGYRRYRQSQLAVARLILMLRRLDMPLAQIGEIINDLAAPTHPDRLRSTPLIEDGLPAASPEAAALLAAYWEAVEQRMAFQRQLVTYLRIRLSGGEERNLSTMFEVKERDIPEQLVLTEQRHIYVQDLANWLQQAIDRLVNTASTLGGPAAPVFVVYHGQVNQDSDGPVEVCVPIQPNGSASPSVATRTEPAHREAYVRITKAQVQYPQILSAYDAVNDWIQSNAHQVANAPREVYFTDFAAAKPTDEVCDIAFPMT